MHIVDFQFINLFCDRSLRTRYAECLGVGRCFHLLDLWAYVDVGNIAYLWFLEKQLWKGEVE